MTGSNGAENISLDRGEKQHTKKKNTQTIFV